MFGKSGTNGEAESYTDKPILPTSSSPSSSRKNRVASWWASQSRLRKILYIALPILLLALILGLALGLTLGRKETEDADPAADYVPSTISGTRASLLQQGYWYTAPSNGTNFNWTSSDPELGNYRSDSQGVDIVVDTSRRFQSIDGFGGALTDSSAYLLDRLRTRESSLYDRVMDFVFNNATGVSITRVSMGASDFSVNDEYSYIPSPPDFTSAANELNDPNSLLGSFTIQGTQSSQHTIPVLVDAMKRNPGLKIVLTPWSPPAFMKSNNTMNGGQLRSGFIPLLAQYYAETAQAWSNAGAKPWAMTLQNEPSHIAAYPSMGMSAVQQVQLAEALKGQLAQRGLGEVQVWGHDDNYAGWQVASDIVNGNSTAVDAIAFHCYRGSPSQIAQFQASLRDGVDKKIHLTECTGTNPSSRWVGIQGWLTNVYWPLAQQNSSSVIQWNLALDHGFGPHLKTSYCSTCSGSLTLSSQWNPANPYVEYNDQMYLTAHFSGASTDLSRVAGGQAVRVDAEMGSQYSLNRNDWQCLNWVVYAAPLSGSTLSTASTTGTQPTRRIGFVIANTCQDTKNVVVSSDGRRTTLPVQQGLTTFIWTAP